MTRQITPPPPSQPGRLRCFCGHVNSTHALLGKRVCLANRCKCKGYKVNPDYFKQPTQKGLSDLASAIRGAITIGEFDLEAYKKDHLL